MRSLCYSRILLGHVTFRDQSDWREIERFSIVSYSQNQRYQISPYNKENITRSQWSGSAGKLHWPSRDWLNLISWDIVMSFLDQSHNELEQNQSNPEYLSTLENCSKWRILTYYFISFLRQVPASWYRLRSQCYRIIQRENFQAHERYTENRCWQVRYREL